MNVWVFKGLLCILSGLLDPEKWKKNLEIVFAATSQRFSPSHEAQAFKAAIPQLLSLGSFDKGNCRIGTC